MDRAAPLADMGARRLPGDVEQGRAGNPRLDQPADRVGRPRSGAGEDHAEAVRTARIAVGHVGRPRLAARHDEADGVAPRQGVEHRHVMDRDHAEGMVDAGTLQRRGHQFADGHSVVHG